MWNSGIKAILYFVLLCGLLSSEGSAQILESEKESHPIRVGVLSSAEKPASNTSQGLYIKILNRAGMDAKAIHADSVKEGGLKDFDIFIIGGGSGTGFNKSLGPDGGAKVEEFVRQGGGG